MAWDRLRFGLSQQPHARLLTAAAREFLRPLGLRQRCRSRTWLDEHGWWLVDVEFQPSSWSMGSYLNVGAMWLWCERDYFSFDDGHRVEGFTAFEDEAQFSPVAESLARRAAEEVKRYRSRYPSVHAAAHHLAARSQGFRSNFHAAVACGLWPVGKQGGCQAVFPADDSHRRRSGLGTGRCIARSGVWRRVGGSGRLSRQNQRGRSSVAPPVTAPGDRGHQDLRRRLAVRRSLSPGLPGGIMGC